MALIYETTETLIPNTTMTKMINADTGILLAYNITPNDGYVLHDKELDHQELNPETMEPIGKVTLGYYPIARSCGTNYDFDNVTTIDGYTAYGEREFFARPISEVPENQDI